MSGGGLSMKIKGTVSRPLIELNSKLSPRQNRLKKNKRLNCRRYKLVYDKLVVEFLWVAAIVLSVEVGMTGRGIH